MLQTFKAVRFLDDFAYAVPVDRTAPFYVVDLSEDRPIGSGQMQVPGFSEYLYPINSHDELLLSLGEDFDETGSILGYDISLFNTSDASHPTLINRLVAKNDENSWSSRSSSWDEHRFLFLPLGETKGMLIVPTSIDTYQPLDESGQFLPNPISKHFEGFSIFNIENGGQITKDFDIEHSLTIPGYESCNHWFEWLPERSCIIDGNVLTMKKHTVISTRLTTGDTLWTIPVNETYVGC